MQCLLPSLGPEFSLQDLKSKKERRHNLSCVSHTPIATLPTSTHTQINVILKGRILFKILFVQNKTQYSNSLGSGQTPAAVSLPCPLHTYSFLILSSFISKRPLPSYTSKSTSSPFPVSVVPNLQQKQICHWGAALPTPS